MNIRLATNQDIGGIIAIEKSCWLDIYPNINEITTEDIENRFDAQNFLSSRTEEIRNEIGELSDKRFVVIEDDKQIVGYARGWKLDEFNDLVEIYVLKEFRGKGLGRLLLADMFSWFDKSKPIILEVAEYNNSAIKFYEKLGFKINTEMKQVPEENWNVLPTGKKIPVVFMVKQA